MLVDNKESIFRVNKIWVLDNALYIDWTLNSLLTHNG